MYDYSVVFSCTVLKSDTTVSVAILILYVVGSTVNQKNICEYHYYENMILTLRFLGHKVMFLEVFFKELKDFNVSFIFNLSYSIVRSPKEVKNSSILFIPFYFLQKTYHNGQLHLLYSLLCRKGKNTFS